MWAAHKMLLIRIRLDWISSMLQVYHKSLIWISHQTWALALVKSALINRIDDKNLNLRIELGFRDSWMIQSTDVWNDQRWFRGICAYFYHLFIENILSFCFGFFFYLALKKASAQFLMIDLPLRMRIYSITSAIR